MANVEVYTTMWCPFCHRAKHLLSGKGITFTEVDVVRHPLVQRIVVAYEQRDREQAEHAALLNGERQS